MKFNITSGPESVESISAALDKLNEKAKICYILIGLLVFLCFLSLLIPGLESVGLIEMPSLNQPFNENLTNKDALICMSAFPALLSLYIFGYIDSRQNNFEPIHPDENITVASWLDVPEIKEYLNKVSEQGRDINISEYVSLKKYHLEAQHRMKVESAYKAIYNRDMSDLKSVA